jgi:hypothetical protein
MLRFCFAVAMLACVMFGVAGCGSEKKPTNEAAKPFETMNKGINEASWIKESAKQPEAAKSQTPEEDKAVAAWPEIVEKVKKGCEEYNGYLKSKSKDAAAPLLFLSVAGYDVRKTDSVFYPFSGVVMTHVGEPVRETDMPPYPGEKEYHFKWDKGNGKWVCTEGKLSRDCWCDGILKYVPF